jgi:ABC-type sugar transport system ATPase subunit
MDTIRSQSELPMLELRNVAKTYGAVRALKDVTFTLRPGEIHALLGHNGAGKSTLVKMLAGSVIPDSGELLVEGAVVSFRNPRQSQASGIAVVDQELSLVPVLSVQDNILLGGIDERFVRRHRHERDKVKTVLSKLGLGGISPDTPVGELAIGERQLVEIARALSREAKVLILDEPTATLSEIEIARVFRVVREVAAEGRSVVFVSHRLGEVLSLCDRATVLRDGAVAATADVADLDRDGIVRLMLGSVPLSVERSASGSEEAHKPVSVAIEGLTVPGAVHGFDLAIRQGQVVGLAGQVGSGASEVLRAVAGLVPEARGRVQVAGRDVRLGARHRAIAGGVAFASNDRKGEGLFLRQTIEQNLVVTRFAELANVGVLRRARTRHLALRLAELIGVKPDRMREAAENLSGGNQQKVFLARCLEDERVSLLLLDEPTRGVDVGGRAGIHRLIRHAAVNGDTVIFASTELDEILELSDVVVTMFAGSVVSIVDGRNAQAPQVLADMTHGPHGGAP